VPDRADYPRSRVMRQVRSTNTGPEVRLRAQLHARGARFRLNQQIKLGEGRPIRPDLTFKGQRVAVFVDGCFWHGCASHCRMPSTNQDYWVTKIARNVARDHATDERLARQGWRVIRVWEHADLSMAADEILAALRRVPSPPQPRG
jgi:DNA mismatch endonuclease, patch repair protein